MTTDPEEVAELRRATVGLTEQVAALSDALNQVSELKDRQQRLDERTLAMQHIVTEQHQLTEHVVEHLGTLDDASTGRLRLVERLRKIMILGAGLIVAGMITGGVLIHEVRRIDGIVVADCNARNQSTRDAILRERELALVAPPGERAAHLDSATSLIASLKDC